MKRIALIIVLFVAPALRAADDSPVTIEGPNSYPLVDDVRKAAHRQLTYKLTRDIEHQLAFAGSIQVPSAGESTETIGYSHPQLSCDSHWAGPMLIIIAGMFLAAAVIGPIVRSEAPEEVPPAHSHDEPPGSSGHHGHSGTIAPSPEHGHH